MKPRHVRLMSAAVHGRGWVLALLASAGLASCSYAPTHAQQPSPADAFMATLSGYCGRAFSGRMVSQDAADAAFVGQAMVMHVRECGKQDIRIPFHVGDDRSRTWVITRTPGGVRLKHQHLHEDGSPDRLTQYGGDSVSPASANRLEFPVDAESIALFTREGRAVSNTNVWAIELIPGEQFVYELRRSGRHFRVEFDLAVDAPLPPPPWGASLD